MPPEATLALIVVENGACHISHFVAYSTEVRHTEEAVFVVEQTLVKALVPILQQIGSV